MIIENINVTYYKIRSCSNNLINRTLNPMADFSVFAVDNVLWLCEPRTCHNGGLKTVINVANSAINRVTLQIRLRSLSSSLRLSPLLVAISV